MFTHNRNTKFLAHVGTSCVIACLVSLSMVNAIKAQPSSNSDGQAQEAVEELDEVEELDKVEELEKQIVVLKGDIDKLKGKTEIIESITKWSFGAVTGLYTLILGLNIVRESALDKQFKKELEFTLKEHIEVLLRGEIIPDTVKEIQKASEEEISKTQNILDTTRSELRLLNYKTTLACADVAASDSIYQYPLALQEYTNAIGILHEEFQARPSSDQEGRRDIQLVMTYSIERLLTLVREIEYLQRKDDTKELIISIPQKQALEMADKLEKVFKSDDALRKNMPVSELIKSLASKT